MIDCKKRKWAGSQQDIRAALLRGSTGKRKRAETEIIPVVNSAVSTCPDITIKPSLV